MVESDQSRQDGLVITATVFTSISIAAVLVRCFIRGVLIRKPGMDDYMIVAALLMDIAYLIEIYVAKANHIGFPGSTLTLDNMTSIVQTTLAIQVCYYVCVTCIKISILFMYLRFAISQMFRKACIWTIVFHAVFGIVCVIVTLAQCRPLYKMWDFTGTVEGSCINTTTFFYFTSGLNIITDIWILAIPIKTLLGINRPQNEKIALVIIFGIGTFATITSIIRLHTIYTYTLAADPFQQAILVNLWSMIEINVAIICASVPALKPLFTPKALKEAASRNKHGGSGYQYHSSEQTTNGPKSAGSRSMDNDDSSLKLNIMGTNGGPKTTIERSTSSPRDGSDDGILQTQKFVMTNSTLDRKKAPQ